MKLIISEKPSVGAAIAAALHVSERKNGYFEGNDCIVSWCIGHLVSLADADAYEERYKKWNYNDLPILPEQFQFVIAPDKKEQFNVLKKLMEREDVTELVNACDAGREGELIFRLVAEMAGCKKPIYRLWISSMEDKAIREGFENLKPGSEYESLYGSALCRQQADWLVGINATRLFSCLYHHTLSVGRVQTPTLSILTEREKKISSFKKEKYYLIHLGIDGCDAVSERISDKEKAEQIKNDCQGKPAVCTSVTSESKNINPPKLFDLTTLQREANRLFGFTAKQTLEYAQSLYEKKLITYPRTDSRYLTSDMVATAGEMVRIVINTSPFDKCTVFEPDVESVISDKDVSDHHALIITAEFEKADLEHLPKGEHDLLLLIANKLLCAVAGKHVYESMTTIFECNGQTFTAKGKNVITEGWKEIERIYLASLKKKPEEQAEEEKPLPVFVKDQAYEDPDTSLTEHDTTPPKPYTEDTLLSAMEHAGADDMPDEAERKGLGTPATRASIIEKLVSGGFIVRKGRNMIPTKDGINLISVLPDTLSSPKLTADWEQQLVQIAQGKEEPEAFMSGIRSMVKDLVKDNSHVSPEAEKLFESEREFLGTCPRCGGNIYEGKKNFYCSNRDCKFVLWKDDRFWTSRKKELTKKMVSTLLKEGSIQVKGMYSKTKDKTYDAKVVLEDTGKYVNFKLCFEKEKQKEVR